LPQQFEGVDVAENREWQPQEIDDAVAKKRRTNKAPKSKYGKIDEERWLPKRDRKKFKKKFKNTDRTQGEA